MERKRCGQCKKIKSIDHFYKHGRSKTGYYETCKSCAPRGPRRLPGNLAESHSSKPGRKFIIFDAGKEIGSITQDKPYDTFSSQEEALKWWSKNRVSYMKSTYQAYLKNECRRPGSRPNIFWELELGLPYPSDEDELLLLESHNLWYPGERDLVLAKKGKISETKSHHCFYKKGEKYFFHHPCGYPIKWPGESAISLVDGKWFRCDCTESSIVREMQEKRINN